MISPKIYLQNFNCFAFKIINFILFDQIKFLFLKISSLISFVLMSVFHNKRYSNNETMNNTSISLQNPYAQKPRKLFPFVKNMTSIDAPKMFQVSRSVNLPLPTEIDAKLENKSKVNPENRGRQNLQMEQTFNVSQKVYGQSRYDRSSSKKIYKYIYGKYNV